MESKNVQIVTTVHGVQVLVYVLQIINCRMTVIKNLNQHLKVINDF